MVVKLPTASEHDRVSKCPSSMALPHVREVPGPLAKKGNVIHHYLEDVRNLGQTEALEKVPQELKEVCQSIDLSLLPTDPSLYAAEVSVAWDYVTGKGRILGTSKDRNYGDTADTELVGTADILGWEGKILIADYKTGWGYVPPAKKNPQLRFLALAASAATGIKIAEVSIISIKPGEPQYHDTAELDALDLDETAADVRRMVSRVIQAHETVAQGRTPDVKEGGWCKYCPSWQSCPAKKGLLASYLEKGPDCLRADDMAEVYHRVRGLEAFAIKSMARLKELVKQEGPIKIGDGMMYGLRHGMCREYKGELSND